MPLHYEDIAKGANAERRTPVIVLAGGAARHPTYLGDLAGLADAQRLVVPHLRGVGRTPMPEHPERGSFWSQAEDLERLRLHLGGGRIVLVAHSAGTRVAVAYAAQFPECVAKLVLITPPAAYLVDQASDTAVIRRRRRGDEAFELALAALAAGPAGTDEYAFNAWQSESAAVGYANWGVTEKTHARTGRWSLAGAEAFFTVPTPADLVARLGKVEAPVLVIAGAQDSLTGVAPAAAMAQLFPSGKSTVIEDSGHYPWVEQPISFRETIDEFLDR
ncbi:MULTISPECIES: alpha/beta hydrolase [unclassified Nesterenkonia]|uniref:alpha/beta fold hydrolase n=1 Tax=unclassified Nesterenkonia TaxID=2629769 RepID=UPI002106D5C1|nr:MULTISPECIES: alpha/beta hydrolase [unclassified Nesterenkonia]